MANWTGFFDAETRRGLRDILVEAGLGGEREFRALLIDLPDKYRAGLPIEGFSVARMRIDAAVNAMNRVISLPGGQRPIVIFLETVLGNLDNNEHIDQIKGLLAVASTVQRTSPAIRAQADGLPLNAGRPVVAANIAALTEFRSLDSGQIEREALIAGVNETLPIGFLERGFQSARSVFKLIIHRHLDGEPHFVANDEPELSWGTAWMIGPGLAATNHHVFAARESFEQPASDADYLKQVETARIVADFFVADEESPGILLGDDTLLARDSALDFAIFKVPDELADRPALTLRQHAVRKRVDQPLRQRVNVLQHPGGGIMRLGFRNNFVVVGDNNILAYLTDTSHGSSGSPVLNDHWEVAALHAGSEPIGDLQIDLQGQRVKRQNFGIPIPTIMRHLEANVPDLHARIIAGQT